MQRVGGLRVDGDSCGILVMQFRFEGCGGVRRGCLDSLLRCSGASGEFSGHCGLRLAAFYSF